MRSGVSAASQAVGTTPMNIVLLYPPPWKISEHGDPPYPTGEGAPAGFNGDAVLSGDFAQIPYGLLSLAAQLLRAGLRVSVFNLSNYPWPKVEKLIHRLVNVDLFGLSCLTANRRGMAMLVRFIHRVHPERTDCCRWTACVGPASRNPRTCSGDKCGCHR